MRIRGVRARSLLSSFGLLAAFTGTANAAEPPAQKAQAAQTQQTQQKQFVSPVEHGGFRALIVVGRCAAARDRIADWLAKDISVAERAGLLELHTMATLWDRSGPPASHDEGTITTRAAGGAVAPASSVKWGEELDVARAEVGRGSYFSALARLDRLLTDAPDLIEAARAVELRALTRDVLRATRGTTAVAETVTAANPTFGATVVNDGSPPPLPPTATKPTSHWYGWQTLIADGAALVTTPIAPLGGFVLYCTGSPIVHLAHGNVKNAGASIGLRVGAPVVGGLLGYGIGRAGDGGGSTSYGTAALAALGILGGAIAAIVVDHAIIAREPVNEDDKPASSAGDSSEKRIAKAPTAASASASASASAASPLVRPAHKAVIESIRPNGGPRKEGGFDVGIVGVW